MCDQIVVWSGGYGIHTHPHTMAEREDDGAIEQISARGSRWCFQIYKLMARKKVIEVRKKHRSPLLDPHIFFTETTP